MKKINVNDEACIGCGACVSLDEEHFAFNDEGLSHPISQDNLNSENLKNAIESCPTSAISLTENSSDNVETSIEDDEDCCCTSCDGHCGCEENE